MDGSGGLWPGQAGQHLEIIILIYIKDIYKSQWVAELALERQNFTSRIAGRTPLLCYHVSPACKLCQQTNYILPRGICHHILQNCQKPLHRLSHFHVTFFLFIFIIFIYYYFFFISHSPFKIKVRMTQNQNFRYQHTSNFEI